MGHNAFSDCWSFQRVSMVDLRRTGFTKGCTSFDILAGKD